MLEEAIVMLFDLVFPQKAKPEPRGQDRMILAEGKLMQLVGKAGITKTALRPAGKVVIDGQNYDACVDGGFIGEGEQVEVVGVRQITLVVRRTV
jgi:membrane-bound serine protease (ClpP class)